ncbi:MAG: hypothetical protein IJE04_04755 [Bacilli bacterium]|nr:hypothetical protein [Bacilli bacterium]
MKKETIEAFLEVKNNEPIVVVKGKEGYTNPQTLIAFLKKGVKSNEIKACTPKQENGYTSYKFKVYNNKADLSHYFVVKVRNKERYLHRATLEIIKDITGVSNLIKKLNVNRVIAGIAATATILTIAGPTIVKGLDELLERDYQYDQQRYRRFSYSTSYIPSEEEKIQSEIMYYEDLRIRAEKGDEEAQKEYDAYLAEQQLKEQLQEESSKTR